MKFLSALLRRPIFWIAIVILAGGIVFLTVAGLPSAGTVRNHLSASDIRHLGDTSGTISKQEHLGAIYQNAKKEENMQGATPGSYNGAYFSLNYPPDYTIKEQDAESGTRLAKLVLVTTGSFSNHLAITLDETQTTTLEDIPSVALRRRKTDIYSEKPITMAGQNGSVFTSSADGYEKIAFVLRGNRLLTISFVTPGNMDTEHAVDYVLKSFQWK